MERLSKKIANAGYASRRKADLLIENGRVRVNGQTITELGYKVKDSDEIEVEGTVLSKEEKVYFLLNKPRGYLSTVTDDKGRKTIVSLIDTTARIYPVGRLDYDTTGAILLTNDGELTNILEHPSNEIEKEYIVKVKGFLPVADIQKLRNGVYVEGRKTSKAKVRVKNYDKKTNTSLVVVIIHEGRNHEVKNMFAALGYDVLKLRRERVAFLTLDGLSSKEYRSLTIKEVKTLYSLAKKKKTTNY